MVTFTAKVTVKANGENHVKSNVKCNGKINVSHYLQRCRSRLENNLQIPVPVLKASE